MKDNATLKEKGQFFNILKHVKVDIFIGDITSHIANEDEDITGQFGKTKIKTTGKVDYWKYIENTDI